MVSSFHVSRYPWRVTVRDSDGAVKADFRIPGSVHTEGAPSMDHAWEGLRGVALAPGDELTIAHDEGDRSARVELG